MGRGIFLVHLTHVLSAWKQGKWKCWRQVSAGWWQILFSLTCSHIPAVAAEPWPRVGPAVPEPCRDSLMRCSSSHHAQRQTGRGALEKQRNQANPGLAAPVYKRGQQEFPCPIRPLVHCIPCPAPNPSQHQMLQSVEQGTVQQGAMLAGPVAINTHLFNFFFYLFSWRLGGTQWFNFSRLFSPNFASKKGFAVMSVSQSSLLSRWRIHCVLLIVV